MSRNYQTVNYIQSLLAKEPELAFHKEMGAENYPAWRKAVRQKVKELMALEGNVYETPIVNLLYTKQRDGYRIDKYEISSEEGLWNTMLVLVPDSATEESPAPMVLCLPGSTWTKEQLAGEDFEDLDYYPAQGTVSGHYFYANTMAQRFVRRGFVAVAVDDFCVGETSDGANPYETWGWVSAVLQSMGRSVLSLTVGMHLAQLRFVKSLPYVDEKRVAVSGHSLGTESLMLMGALDDSIGAMIFNDFLSDSKERLLACCPGIPYNSLVQPYKHYYESYRYFTYPDLLAAFAPGKLLITEGGVTALLEKVRDAYALAGVPDAFTYQYYREYADPAKRKHDHEKMPMGLTNEAYFEYANVVPEHHYFKFETAVPWLEKVMK